MSGGVAAFVGSLIVGAMTATGYAGLTLLMAAESTGAPLPSEIILPFAGYLVSQHRMSLWLAATFGALGCNLGSLAAYELARWGGRRLLERRGRWLLITPADIARADRFFARFGGVAVLVGRLLPFVRGFISYPAGIARMPRLRFHLYTFAGSWPWCFALAWMGEALGRRWADDPAAHRILHWADWAVLAAVAALVPLFVWRRTRFAQGGARRS
jgi:membrane protein DedA with SNARE-associated domain